MFFKFVLFLTTLIFLTGCEEDPNKITFDRSIFRECMGLAISLRSVQFQNQMLPTHDLEIEDDGVVRESLIRCEGIATIHSDVIVIDSDVKPTVVVKEQKHV